jgi:hypothetical protein
MITEEAIVKNALDGNFESRDQQERWLADHLRNAYTNGFIAGQEAQHRNTWALAMESAKATAHGVWNDSKIWWDIERLDNELCQLACPPIEATKDK